jgi:hypothetical protein
MKNKLNNLMNIIMGSSVGVFIGQSLFKYMHYRNNPQIYVIQSAPWYTGIIIYGVVDLSILLIAFTLKILLLKRNSD